MIALRHCSRKTMEIFQSATVVPKGSHVVPEWLMEGVMGALAVFTCKKISYFKAISYNWEQFDFWQWGRQKHLWDNPPLSNTTAL